LARAAATAAALLALVACAGGASIAGAGGLDQLVTRGNPTTGAPGVRRTTAELNAASTAVEPRVAPRFRRVQPKSNSSVSLAGVAAATPSPSLGVSASFLGATLADSGYVPPDTEGDIGPSQYLLTVNGRVRVFSKAGTVGALNTTLDGFFSAVLESGAFTTDPRVRFDRTSNRWFVTCLSVPPSFASNRILIAMSDGPTITNSTVWTFFYFQHDLPSGGGDTGDFADFDTLGVDANALYIGANIFTPDGFLVGSSGYVVRKSSLTSGGPIVVTAFRDLGDGSGGPFTPQGASDLDPAATQGYFVGVDAAFFSLLDLRRVSDPGGTPSISGNLLVFVPTTAFPVFPGVTVPGSSFPLDTIDDRLSEAVVRNGVLYVAHNIGVDSSGVASSSPTRTATRWYEIANLSGTPGLSLSGTVFNAAGVNPVSYWMPSIAVSGQGHALLGMSMGGATTRPQGATSTLLSGQSSFSAPQPYVGGGAFPYNPSFDPHIFGAYRWGDYSRTTVDPCDDQTFWTIQEFVAGSDNWGVQVGEIPAPPPATPVSASPPTVTIGQASVNVTITGTSSGGSAFFDTGSGSCRLAATTPGVTVNSATFIDGTHVTLNLSTVGATTGTKTVTVTNPDGQSATSGVSILTVVASPANAVAPRVLGPPFVGSTLSADPGTWSGFPIPSLTYQWKRCNTVGAGCVDIGGQTTSTYIPVVGDVGSVIRVLVTATNTLGSASALSSSRTPSDTLIRAQPPSR
jgi:hypothetical protein